MAKFGKWIGGGLGWAFMGPLGGLIGFAVGSILDKQDAPTTESRTYRRGTTYRGDFMTSLIVLIAALMKADGKVLKSELDYVKANLERNFGVQSAAEAVILLRDILKQDIPVEEISQQISRHMDYSSRLQLLHLLFGVSKADGHVSVQEMKVIERISYYMGIRSNDLQSIKSLFYDDLNAAYTILEITQDASDEEVRKAYRKMAVKYHPDKVSYLGEDIKEKAKEKFQKLNEAYEKIKKSRGIS